MFVIFINCVTLVMYNPLDKQCPGVKCLRSSNILSSLFLLLKWWLRWWQWELSVKKATYKINGTDSIALLSLLAWVRANQLYHKHNFPHVLIGLEIITSPADYNNRKKGCVYPAASRKSCLSVKFVSFRQSCASAHFGPCLWRKMMLSSFAYLDYKANKFTG